MRVLVTGGSGLLGQKIIELGRHRFFATYQQQIPTDTKRVEFFPLDIRNRQEVRSLAQSLRPDVIVHAASFRDVEGCERDRETAYGVNVEGTRNVASAAEEVQAKMVYVSTNYVFDGQKGMYQEDDEPNPVNYYGITKLQGEKSVQQICQDYMIIRTSFIFGWGRPNLFTLVVEELTRGREIRAVTDLLESPTLNADLADQIGSLLDRDERGIFHAAGPERTNRFDFAKQIARTFGLDENLIVPTSVGEMNWMGTRPKDSSLDIAKISQIKMPLSVKDALKKAKEERY